MPFDSNNFGTFITVIHFGGVAKNMLIQIDIYYNMFNLNDFRCNSYCFIQIIAYYLVFHFMIPIVNFICLSAINANYRETPKWQTWPFMHCTITTTVTVIILNPSFYFCFISFLFMPTKRQCASLKYFSVQYYKQKKEMHFLFDI